ncbi:MAG: 4Fe-4S dicluster domain-containing protein [Verrucomicrobia bacterium]|nr:4Fe-4S dicluster domain-containing protein [Verrucomicrobiota bacterium]
MKANRRRFLQGLAATAGVLGLPGSARAEAVASVEHFTGYPDRFGMLVDLTLCIGCRKCEEACQQTHQLPPLAEPPEDQRVFDRHRRTDAGRYTVVNRLTRTDPDLPPVFVKQQCMHCNEPACAAACLVGAFTKSREGAVLYNQDICLGCRYCMIACPFNIPAYEYHNPASPKVRKCNFCHARLQRGDLPACASICPREALTFGKRSDLIKLAGEIMRKHPGKYQDHVYGITEAGGTSWLYLSELPFAALGFPMNLGTKPFADYTRGFLSAVPVVFVAWPALLGGFHLFSKSRSAPPANDPTSPAEPHPTP